MCQRKDCGEDVRRPGPAASSESESGTGPRRRHPPHRGVQVPEGLLGHPGGDLGPHPAEGRSVVRTTTRRPVRSTEASTASPSRGTRVCRSRTSSRHPLGGGLPRPPPGRRPPPAPQATTVTSSPGRATRASPRATWQSPGAGARPRRRRRGDTGSRKTTGPGSRIAAASRPLAAAAVAGITTLRPGTAAEGGRIGEVPVGRAPRARRAPAAPGAPGCRPAPAACAASSPSEAGEMAGGDLGHRAQAASGGAHRRPHQARAGGWGSRSPAAGRTAPAAPGDPVRPAEAAHVGAQHHHRRRRAPSPRPGPGPGPRPGSPQARPRPAAAASAAAGAATTGRRPPARDRPAAAAHSRARATRERTFSSRWDRRASSSRPRLPRNSSKRGRGSRASQERRASAST